MIGIAWWDFEASRRPLLGRRSQRRTAQPSCNYARTPANRCESTRSRFRSRARMFHWR
jgi:hypothetical protein